MDLLKQALTSTSPLSDVFLGNGEFKKMDTFSPKKERLIYNSVTINLKVTVRKSKKKILYAEADGDFVDFLFSFLTTPIGSVLELLNNDNFSLGCIDNLHKSVKDLNPSWFTRPSLGTLLLNPKVAFQFGCIRQPLNLREEDTPSYWCGTGVLRNNTLYTNPNGVISKKSSLISQPEAMRLFDPRSPDGGKRDSVVGFVRRPSLFVVWDDLQVTPLANTSSVFFLQKLNVPLDDLEDHVVSIGGREVTIPLLTSFYLLLQILILENIIMIISLLLKIM